MIREWMLFLLGGALITAGCGTGTTDSQQTAEADKEPELKYGIAVQSGPMDEILLKDYDPHSSLVVPETRIEKARIPVIDIHTHTSMSRIKSPADVDAWVETMDAVGIERTIVFTGATGDEFDRQAELYMSRHPDRFQVWCDLLTEDIDAPDYPERAAAELERCYRAGARGLGEISDKGWGLQGGEIPRDKRLHFDDPRLKPVWDKCAELGMPVNFHVADHPSCWQPLGPHQERSPDFQHFNMTDKDVPTYEELLAMRDRMLEANPGTLFIACHLSNQGNDLASLSEALDRYSNLYIDVSARDYELGRQPRTAARFLAKYHDRVLFGTDMGAGAEMYRGWWRLLETPDEYIAGRVWWPYYGLDLPDQTLQPLYRGNALRLLQWD